MKTKYLFSSIVLVFALLPGIANAQLSDSCNPDVAIAVEESMHSFLENVPEEYLKNFGVNNLEELNADAVGSPIAVYHLLNSNLVFSNVYRVPLVIDNEYKALFTVVMQGEGDYKIVDFGAALLASEIYEESRINDLVGLLRIYQLREDFFILINSKGEEEYKAVSRSGKPVFSLANIVDMLEEQP